MNWILLVGLGFNCGEAVNFAVSGWFPFGAEATRRYAHLRMMPMIPFEELLCNEAMLIYKAAPKNIKGSNNTILNLESNHATKLSFIRLMQSYDDALSKLQKGSIENCSSSSNSLGTVVCSLCRRDCYVAFLLCKKCYSHSICIFHDGKILLIIIIGYYLKCSLFVSSGVLGFVFI